MIDIALHTPTAVLAGVILLAVVFWIVGEIAR